MEDNEIDDILNLDDDITPVQELLSDQAENICGEMGEVKPAPQILDSLPEVLGEDIPQNFARISDRILAQYRMLPKVDYVAIYDELEGLAVKSGATPTLQQINRELQKIQAVKERLSEIITQILPSHTIKKRSVEILKDAWIKFTTEKTADRRKADSVYRISEFESDFLATDALLKTSMHVAKTLDSVQDLLSRRITIMGLQLKLHDMGRNSMPDYEHGASMLDDGVEGIGIDASMEQISPSDGPLEAQELEF